MNVAGILRVEEQPLLADRSVPVVGTPWPERRRIWETVSISSEAWQGRGPEEGKLGAPHPDKDFAAEVKSRAERLEQTLEIAELASRDLEVRSHEAAHQAAGGGLTGAATFTYVRGPDGRMYAVSGEVPIDVSPERTPEATIAKARRIRAAATAPADPSAQDMRIAAAATALEMEALFRMAAEARAQREQEHAAQRQAGGSSPSAQETQPEHPWAAKAARAYGRSTESSSEAAVARVWSP